MSIYEIAKQDLIDIMGADNPKVTIDFVSGESEEIPIMPQDIAFTDDPDTGLRVRGETKSIAVPIESLQDREIDFITWEGVKYHLSSAPIPDKTLGLTILMLTRKNLGGSRKYGYTLR